MNEIWRVTPLFPGALPIFSVLFIPSVELFLIGCALLLFVIPISVHRVRRTVLGDEPEGEE